MKVGNRVGILPLGFHDYSWIINKVTLCIFAIQVGKLIRISNHETI